MTVGVGDGSPGWRVIDFASMGFILGPGARRSRRVHALIFNVAHSRLAHAHRRVTPTRSRRPEGSNPLPSYKHQLVKATHVDAPDKPLMRNFRFINGRSRLCACIRVKWRRTGWCRETHCKPGWPAARPHEDSVGELSLPRRPEGHGAARYARNPRAPPGHTGSDRDGHDSPRLTDLPTRGRPRGAPTRGRVTLAHGRESDVPRHSGDPSTTQRGPCPRPWEHPRCTRRTFPTPDPPAEHLPYAAAGAGWPTALRAATLARISMTRRTPETLKVKTTKNNVARYTLGVPES